MKKQEGIIIKSTGSWYDLLTGEGKILKARIKGKIRLKGSKNTNPVAVGDGVTFTIDTDGHAVIEQVAARRNYIIRKSNNLSRQEHIIAANLDQVMIIATIAFPRTSIGFIDRILVTAEAYEIPVIIVFNKTDIYSEDENAFLNEVREMYEAIGYKTITASFKNKKGPDEIREILSGKTTLITGHSGVGKSTLLNLLMPGLDLKTANVSASSLKGKHTTTFAEMHQLDEETKIIDTPGIKDFGLVEMKPEETGHFFPEMRKYLGQCRFNNCMHINEPGCRVLEALENGEIHPYRYASYLSIIDNQETHR